MADFTLDVLILVMFFYFTLMSLVNKKPVTPKTAHLYTKESNEKLSLVMGIVYAVGTLMYLVVVLAHHGYLPAVLGGWIPVAVILALLVVSYLIASRRILVPVKAKKKKADGKKAK